MYITQKLICNESCTVTWWKTHKLCLFIDILGYQILKPAQVWRGNSRKGGKKPLPLRQIDSRGTRELARASRTPRLPRFKCGRDQASAEKKTVKQPKSKYTSAMTITNFRQQSSCLKVGFKILKHCKQSFAFWDLFQFSKWRSRTRYELIGSISRMITKR